MLPTELENLVGHYAYGEGRYCLDEEVDFLATNRGMIPDSFLEHAVARLGYAPEQNSVCEPLGGYMVQNPLRTDNPFFPWALVDPRARVLGNTFFWWEGRVNCQTYRKLKTYRKTFRAHVVRMINRGRDVSIEWNIFVNRYMHFSYLSKPESYDSDDHEVLVSQICEELKTAGYLSPRISLPPRPSQRSVLSPPSSPPA